MYKRTGRPTGRPPIAEDGPTSTRISVPFTPDQDAALRQTARELRLSVAALIRTALNVFVADAGDPPIFRRVR
jgi:hypothetical protein